jgi:hypothetical protein
MEKKFRDRLNDDPKFAAIQPRAIINAFRRELQKAPSNIRHRIAGMDSNGPLPDYFERHQTNSEGPFVTALLLYVPKDWMDGTVILPSGERRQILVCEEDSELWFEDETRSSVPAVAPDMADETSDVPPRDDHAPMESPNADAQSDRVAQLTQAPDVVAFCAALQRILTMQNAEVEKPDFMRALRERFSCVGRPALDHWKRFDAKLRAKRGGVTAEVRAARDRGKSIMAAYLDNS